MIFYDCHAHRIEEQNGGILIGLEGENFSEGCMRNVDVQRATSNSPCFLPCYYITKAWNDVPDETLLKYHPRREQYSPDEVIADLERRKCRLCIIDTLNQPHWGYIDYWKVVASFPDVLFILPHMGGYDIIDFVKIIDFNKNVYCDFSMTQEYFGWCGTRAKLNVVTDAIDYCLSHPKLKQKVLFGSDAPDFSQSIALAKYSSLKYAEDFLVNNFKKLLNIM